MINFRGDATLNEREPLPDGDYFLTVTDTEEKKSKSGRPMIQMELVVCHGEYADKKRVKFWLTFIPAGEPGHGMTLHALHAFGFPHDGQININAKDFEGRTVKAKVASEEYNGYQNNVIKDFYILTDEQMTEDVKTEEEPAAEEQERETVPPAAKAAPVAAKVVATKTVPATPGRKLPWAKK